MKYVNKTTFNIGETTVVIKSGDIFKQKGWKVIPFNEYFDTTVDNKIIAEKSLNGLFIQKTINKDPGVLDKYIKNYSGSTLKKDKINSDRNNGNQQQYQLGSICIYDDYLLTAFSKFDNENNARLTIKEYINFLMEFWKNIDIIYNQKSVSIPVFGSGITRMEGYPNINIENLLKIILWTFQSSNISIKSPANLKIIMLKNKIKKINLLEIKNLNLVNVTDTLIKDLEVVLQSKLF